MDKMESTVGELKKAIPFKNGTDEGDVVLMVKEPDEENQPFFLSYARITGFERDPGKIDEWWFVHLTFLSVPPQPVTFILQTPHFTGQEIFTMGGKKVFIKAVAFSGTDEPEEPEEDGDAEPKATGKRKGLTLVKSS